MRINTMRSTLFAGIALCFMLASCQLPGLPTPEIEPPPEVEPPLEIEKQEELAQQKYLDLLESTARMHRTEKRDIMAEGFKEVIAKYPDSSYAHESYFHLIRAYFYNYDQPMEKEAEEVYESYFRKYEDPKIENALNLEMAKYYYQSQRWNKLVSFTVPFMQEFVETGKMRDGLFLFYYSEAKYKLKDYGEALRGYVTYSNLYPKNSMEWFVGKRLKELRHILSKEEAGR